MKIIRGIPQGSDEWLRLKDGRAGASHADWVMAKGRGKGEEFGQSFMNYAYLLASQKLGYAKETYKSDAMQRGNTNEPMAAMRYSIEKGLRIEEITGILVNEDVLISPDRLVGDIGLVEIKNPDTLNHIKYICAGTCPYIEQTQAQLWGSEREWNDFVSYDDRCTEQDFFCLRTYRDEPYIKIMEYRYKVLIEKRDEIIYYIKNYKPCQ